MLNDLLAALNDCVWAFDINTQNYLFISPSIYDVSGYKIKDFHQNINLWNEIIDPRDYPEVTVAEDKPGTNDWVDLTHRIINKRGKIKWVHQKKRRLTDEHTGHQIVLCVINDVSDDKHAQEEIIWTKNNLEALINNTEDLTWSIDREGRYVYMNTAYRKRITENVGVAPKEGDNAYIHSGNTDKINEEWKSYYQRAFSGERYITRHESPDPQTKESSYFEVSFNPIYKTTKGEITGVGCFARDITERLNTEQALIEQNERLRNIASLSSHELRRPVATMLGLLNIMDRTNFNNPENEQIIEHLFTVGNEIDEVIRLIVNKTFIDARYPL
jgi:PAS domain S-box-containing protein